MKNVIVEPTIRAEHGYRLIKETNKDTFKLFDGDRFIMKATYRPWGDLIEELEEEGNECAVFCECFETVNYTRYIYWRDEEANEDYLSLVGRWEE